MTAYRIPCKILTAVSTKMSMSLVALIMEAAGTPKTLVNFHQTARRYNPEDSHIRVHRREKFELRLVHIRALVSKFVHFRV